MKFWKVVLILVFLPLALLYRAGGIILGKERARKFFYQAIVSVSARVLVWNIPTLKKGQPFSAFSDHFIKVLSRMPFETINVTIQTDDTFQINVTRCQFVEVFQFLGMPELTPALCEGDVAFCEKYQPLVRFQRHHTLSAGDGFCDHTYVHQRDQPKRIVA
jgi:hypothetical protein